MTNMVHKNYKYVKHLDHQLSVWLAWRWEVYEVILPPWRIRIINIDIGIFNKYCKLFFYKLT